MEIQELQKTGQKIWGREKLTLAQIIARLGKVFGDICRWERNAPKDAAMHNDEELKKELGNMIFSTILWCEELGFNPEECINIAIECQEKYNRK